MKETGKLIKGVVMERNDSLNRIGTKASFKIIFGAGMEPTTTVPTGTSTSGNSRMDL